MRLKMGIYKLKQIKEKKYRLWTVLFILMFTVSTLCFAETTQNGLILKDGKIRKKAIFNPKQGLEFPSKSQKAAVLFSQIKLNFLEGGIGVSLKLKSPSKSRIICCIKGLAYEKNKSWNGISIVYSKTHFLFAAGQKTNFRAYFRHDGLIKENKFYNVSFRWQRETDGQTKVTCFVGDKAIGRAIKIKGLPTQDTAKEIFGQLVLGQYFSGSAPYGFNGTINKVFLYGNLPIIKKKQNTNLKNIAPLIKITSNPYCGTLQYLTDGEVPAGRGSEMINDKSFFEEVEMQSDGNIATFAAFPIKSSKQQIIFKFPVSISLSKIRFFQRKACSQAYVIEGDKDGDGKFETFLGYGKGTPDAWSEILIDCSKSLQAMRFTNLKGVGRGAPQIAEFQIFSDSKTAKVLKKAKEINAKELKFSKAKSFPGYSNIPAKNKYQFGVCCSLWMFVNHSAPYKKEKEASQYPLKIMKELDMDRMKLFANILTNSKEKVLFPTDPEYSSRINLTEIKKSKRYRGAWDCVPWPSKVLISYKDNVLKRFVHDAKKHNIKVSVIPPRNGPPFDVRSGYYPMAQADRYSKKPDPRFPCVWYGGYWKPAFKKILAEIAGSGVQNIDVIPDEFYIEGHSLKNIPANDPCRKLFKKQYGIDIPAKADNSEAYRKWLMFQYNSTAKTFADFISTVKKVNPDIHTETNFSVAPLLFYNNPSFTLAYDIVGHAGNYDSLGTDPYYRPDTLGHYQMPKTAVIFQGATPNRNTTMLLQAVCGDWKTQLKDPVWLAGNATSILMRGVHEIDFYRLNYFAPLSARVKKGKAFYFVKNWIKMIRSLEGLGLKKAKVPKDIAFVYSRAGIDWWELAEMSRERKKAGKKHFYPNSAMAGYAHHDATMKILFKNGCPFDLFYLDQPTTLKNAANYKVMVIPFAYSISKKAFNVIQNAYKNGTKLLIIGKKGETDEIGSKYPKPLLEQLIGKPGVKYLDIDLLKNGNASETKEKILTAIDKLLGSEKRFFVNTHNKDVEVGLLINEKTWFIPVVNWHNKSVKIDIGLKLPTGKYKLLRYGLNGVSQAETKILSAKELEKFSVKLKAHETFIFVVTPLTSK
jgi:hypothetical protein